MCVSPVEVSYKYLTKTRKRLVPCGTCIECVKKNQNGFALRTMIEARKRGSMWFFTLTYNDSALPYAVDENTGECIPSLRRSDVKKMFHDVRQSSTRSGRSLSDFSYMYCGEYGPRTHRPHYHGCLLGLPDSDVELFRRYWSDRFGFVVFKKVPLLDNTGKDNIAFVARYIAKYVTKPKQFELDFVNRGVVEKPRKVTSVNYGMISDDYKKYILGDMSLNLSNRSLRSMYDFVDRLHISVNGFDYALPQYLIKKLFYVQNYKGNLSASALYSMAKAVVRSKSVDKFDETLRLLRQNGCSDEEIGKVLHQIQTFQENDFDTRRLSATKDLQTFYQKSKF